MKKISFSLCIILGGSFFYNFTKAIDTISSGFKVLAGNTILINAHGICKNVTNNKSNDIFIPTATSNEWSTFIANIPSNVVLNSCSGISQSTTGLSCKQILDSGFSVGNTTYWINPNGGSISDAFQVYCDMTTNGGGWTVIIDPSNTVNHCSEIDRLGGSCDATIATANAASSSQALCGVADTGSNNSYARFCFGNSKIKDLVVTEVRYRVSNSSGCGQGWGMQIRIDDGSYPVATINNDDSYHIYNHTSSFAITYAGSGVGCPGTVNLKHLSFR